MYKSYRVLMELDGDTPKGACMASVLSLHCGRLHSDDSII